MERTQKTYSNFEMLFWEKKSGSEYWTCFKIEYFKYMEDAISYAKEQTVKISINFCLYYTKDDILIHVNKIIPFKS